MEIETPVLLAYAIEDSTDIFRISGGFEPPPPLSVRWGEVTAFLVRSRAIEMRAQIALLRHSFISEV